MDDELKFAVNSYFWGYTKEFCHTGIERLVSRYNKCLDKLGDYAQK